MTPGEQLMDYIHIDDVVTAFEAASEHLLSKQNKAGSFSRYTVRSLEVKSLKKFIEILCAITGKQPLIAWGAKDYPQNQIMSPWLPTSTAQVPGWTPQHSFNDGIRDVIENER